MPTDRTRRPQALNRGLNEESLRRLQGALSSQQPGLTLAIEKQVGGASKATAVPPGQAFPASPTLLRLMLAMEAESPAGKLATRLGSLATGNYLRGRSTPSDRRVRGLTLRVRRVEGEQSSDASRGAKKLRATVALALHGSSRAAATEKPRPKQPKQCLKCRRLT